MRWGIGQVLLLTEVLGNRLVASVKVLSLGVVFGSILCGHFCFFVLVFEFILSQLNTKINNKGDNSQYSFQQTYNHKRR